MPSANAWAATRASSCAVPSIGRHCMTNTHARRWSSCRRGTRVLVWARWRRSRGGRRLWATTWTGCATPRPRAASWCGWEMSRRCARPRSTWSTTRRGWPSWAPAAAISSGADTRGTPSRIGSWSCTSSWAAVRPPRFDHAAWRSTLDDVPAFELKASFAPAGDQPKAVEQLDRGLRDGLREQILLGVTGSGKTFSIAHVIQKQQRPTLVLSPNKTLAAQLWAEFREFFPNNAVEYFVSYYDYYQPEAYIPRTDTYIEKDSSRNEEIDRLRNSATRALLTRRDVIVVASISCIYGIGSPENYLGESLSVKVGDSIRRDIVLRKLTDLQYTRNDLDFGRSRFRVRGDVVDVQPAYEEIATRIEFFGDEVEAIRDLDPLTGEILRVRDELTVFPASHYVTPREQLERAVHRIEAELEERSGELEARGRLLEAQRLRQRTNFDLEMLRETGTCAGVENYSRHLARRPAGSRPWTLLDYFPPDFLAFVDESHISMPQVRGMYFGDRS